MKNLLKGVALVGVVLVLLATAVVSACGGGGIKETNTVTLGWLADQTGPSSLAFEQVMMGMNDYLAQMKVTNPISGVNLKIITYDTRLELARFPGGYQWLKGQGMDVLLGYQPITPAMTQPDQAADKIPQYNFDAWPTTMDADWVYCYMYTVQLEARATLDYLINQWWPTQNIDRPVKVGWVGNPEQDTHPEFEKGFNYTLEQNPGKAQLIKAGGSSTQSAWASEVAAIEDCDVIMLSTVGTSTATFLKEAIQRGYKGQIEASTLSVLGVWDLVTAVTPKSSFNGMLIPHFYPLWTDNTPYVQQASEVLTTNHPAEAATLKSGTTWISGWLTANILCEAVRDAAAKVGAKNVDGAAINDALLALNIEIEGMPNITLANSGAHHVLQPECRMIRYDAAQDNWYAITDWFVAPGFTS